MRWAIIKNGIVSNTIEWDGAAPYTPPVGATLRPLPVDSPVGIGWTWDGKEFTPTLSGDNDGTDTQE